MPPKFVTIGVYGFDEVSLFKALLDQGVDMFCDIRQRRSVRGAKYAFVNSLYLQKKLQDLEIQYLHYKPLAPTKTVRRRQKDDDKTQKVKKRERQTLSPSFIEAYETECLVEFDAVAFVNSFDPAVKKVALFCVEREPEACHRSLVAQKLFADVGIQVEHLTP